MNELDEDDSYLENVSYEEGLAMYHRACNKVIVCGVCESTITADQRPHAYSLHTNPCAEDATFITMCSPCRSKIVEFKSPKRFLN